MDKNVINGYIIQNEEGKYLSRDRWWVDHESPEEAFLHTPDSILAIALLVEADNWESKPVSVIPASFDKGTIRVVLTGEKKYFPDEVARLNGERKVEVAPTPPQIISSDEIQKLLAGETVTVSTSLESSNGDDVGIECYIIPTEYPRKWVLVTAVANQVALGFVDGIFYGEYKTSKIESPHTMRTRVPGFKHTEIRYEAEDDGVFVSESERGRGIGRQLMLTMRSILIGLGADVMTVNQVKEEAEGFYRSLGMRQGLGAFQEIFEKTDKE